MSKLTEMQATLSAAQVQLSRMIAELPVVDTTPPTVSLNVSSNNVTAAGNLILTASASDDVAVTRVEFYRGSTLLGQDTTTPYTFSEAMSFSSNGTYQYKARAYDAAGNWTDSVVQTVTINIPAPPQSNASISNTGNAFTLSWPEYPGAQFVVYSAYAATGRMFVPISLWIQGTTFRDPNVKDGRAVWYQVRRWVGGVETLHAELNGVQPARVWEDAADLPPGKYVGRNFRSLSLGIRAFKLSACSPTQLYDFEDCGFMGVSDLMQGFFARVKARDSRFWGVMPPGTDKQHGRGLALEQVRHADVQYCFFEDIAANYMTQFQSTGAAGDTILFDNNFGRNIMGQWTDGAGGYRLGNQSGVDCVYGQMLQLAKCRPGIAGDPNATGIRGGGARRNYVSNEPNYSRVEDNYSDFKTVGYPDSKFQMTDNMTDGAYPWRPTVHTGYSGGVYMVGDEGGDEIEQNRNIGIRYTNYGSGIMNGVGNVSDNGRYVRSAYLWNGERMTIVPPSGLIGLQFWDYNGVGAGMNNNRMNNNYVANQYARSDGTLVTNSFFVTVAGQNGNQFNGNVEFTGEVTVEMEWAEHRVWRDRMAAAGQTFGPRPPV